MFTLMALLYIGGITSSPGSIINLFLNNGSFDTSRFMIKFIFVIGGSIAAGAIAGIFGRSISESYILVPLFSGFLINYLMDFKTVLDVVNNTGQIWLYWITFIVMGGLAAGYSIALVQFWRGNDI